MPPDVEVEAAIALGTRQPADEGIALQHRRPHPALEELVRRGEAGGASADDDDVLSSHRTTDFCSSLRFEPRLVRGETRVSHRRPLAPARVPIAGRADCQRWRGTAMATANPQ